MTDSNIQKGRPSWGLKFFLNPLIFSHSQISPLAKGQQIIEYKLLSLSLSLSLSLTKFLQLLNLAIFTTLSVITLQPPRSTRCSSVVTLSRSPTISLLKITDHSFTYASPRLWNQLPDSFRQPHRSCLDSPPHPRTRGCAI